MYKYILASASPRRKELFGFIADDFDCISPNVEEIVPEDIPTYKSVEYLAKIKANFIAKNLTDTIVVSADTAVFADGQMLGKPKDNQDAFNMLKMLSGKTHKVITGCCVCLNGKEICFSEQTEVTFFDLTDQEINDYIATGEPNDKAGAYGIQGKGRMLIKGINGDFYNVVGLPVARLNREIKRFCDF